MKLIPEVQYLKELTQNFGLEYAEVAAKSGVPLPTVKAVFCGQIKCPSIRTLRALQAALGVTEEVTPEEAALLAQYRSLAPHLKETLKTVLTALARRN